jgi:hypothetical protein
MLGLAASWGNAPNDFGEIFSVFGIDSADLGAPDSCQDVLLKRFVTHPER